MVTFNPSFPSMTTALSEAATTASRFFPSFIFKASYVAEQQGKQTPFVNRFLQLVQVETAMVFTVKAIQCIRPFSLDWKVNFICFAIGIIPKVIDLNKINNAYTHLIVKAWQKIDQNWGDFATAARILAVAAACGLIAGGEVAEGFAFVGCIGLGFLESKKIIPVQISQWINAGYRALNIGVVGATLLTTSFYTQLLLIAHVANELINLIGHKYRPLNNPVTKEEEKQLVSSIRNLTSPEKIISNERCLVLSQEFLKWRAIPPVFTLTCPDFEKKKENIFEGILSYGIPKKALETWISTIQSKYERKDDKTLIHKYKIQAKTTFLINLQSELKERCRAIYYNEKNRIIFNPFISDPKKTNSFSCLKDNFLSFFEPWDELDGSDRTKCMNQCRKFYFDAKIEGQMEGIDRNYEDDGELLRKLWDQFASIHLYPTNPRQLKRMSTYFDRLNNLQMPELDEERAQEFKKTQARLKKVILLNLDSITYQDHLNQIKELEVIRSLLIQQIPDLLDEEEKASFLEAIKTDCYEDLFSDPLEKSILEWQKAYQEFITHHSFDIRTEPETFIRLSILGNLQQRRQKRIYQKVSSYFPLSSEEENSHLINSIFSNALGLQGKINETLPKPNYLFALLSLKMVTEEGLNVNHILSAKTHLQTLPNELTLMERKDTQEQNQQTKKYLNDLGILL